MAEDKDDEKKKDDGVGNNNAWIDELTGVESKKLKSPVNLNISNMTVKKLKPLAWCNYRVAPIKLKLTNTSKTVILSAKWNGQRPYITGGPLSSRYTFSQVHFHWDRNGTAEGSQHSVDGAKLPMELHAVHSKSEYANEKMAMRKSDGVCVLIYFFKLQSLDNPMMNEIVKNLGSVQRVDSSTRIAPWAVSNLLTIFLDDYFFYRGSITFGIHEHSILWLISRYPIGISVQQIGEFQRLQQRVDLDATDGRNLQKPNDETEESRAAVCHVNPSGSTYASLLPISRGIAQPRRGNGLVGIARCEGDAEEQEGI